MKTKSITLGAALVLLASSGYSYSHNGHYLIGAIADQTLAGTPAGAKVKALIGRVSLAAAATIPDEMKDWDPGGRKFHLPFNVTTNKKLNSALEDFLHANQTGPDCSGELLHHEYHFTDIEVFEPATYSETQVGANNHDLPHMISFCIEVLSGDRSADNPQKITKPVALVLLVHYVGDLHQPLHVGAEYFDHNGNAVNPNSTTTFAGDKGGNSLALVLPSLSDSHPTHPGNLHHYWDEIAVERATNNWAKQINPTKPHSVSLDDIAKFLKDRLPAGWTAEPTINAASFAVDCANEILPVAREAHQRLIFSGIAESGGTARVQVVSGNATALPTADYSDFAGNTVADEIQKGGHRLADLLEAILK